MASDRLVHTSARQSNAVTHPSTRVAGTLLPRHRNAQGTKARRSWRLAPKRISGPCHSTSPCLLPAQAQAARSEVKARRKPPHHCGHNLSCAAGSLQAADCSVCICIYMRRQTKNNLDVSGRPPESSKRRQHSKYMGIGIDQWRCGHVTDGHVATHACRSYATRSR